MGSPPNSLKKIVNFEWLEPEGTPPEEVMTHLPDWIKEQKLWSFPQYKWNFSPPK